MEITHVIRADEWIPSTPKHLAIYDALSWPRPQFAHVPAVLGTDGHKLSKRRGARNVLEYGELGYMASAVVNAMALLGWSSGTDEEVFTVQELCERFTLERIHPAPAVFDPKRLDDLNGVHIRRLDTEALVEALEFPLPGTSKEVRRRLVPMLRERMVTLLDARRLAAPLLGDVVWQPDVDFPPPGVSVELATMLLDECIAAVEDGMLEDPTALRERLTRLVEASGAKPRIVFRVLFIAILGSPAGLPVFDSMAFLGPEKTLLRLRAARKLLENLPPPSG